MSSSSKEAASKADDKRACSLSITNLSWGSTTGKPYLDEARLDDSESTGGVWNVFVRKAGGDGKDGSKENVNDNDK